MERFEKGKFYPLHFKSKCWNELAGKIEIVDIEYFEKPKEFNEQDTRCGILDIGIAKIRYVDTKYYKNKLFDVGVVGYFKNDLRDEEKTCISLDNKFYFSVFL
jgi:hypothetical protein